MVEVQQSSPRARRIGCSVFAGVIIFLIALFAIAGMAGGGEDDTPEATETPVATETTVAGPRATEWDTIDDWLRVGYFMLDDWSDFALPDGQVSWQQHVERIEVDGTTAVVRMNLDASNPAAQHLGEEAASFVATQARIQNPDVAAGVKWAQANASDGSMLARAHGF